MISEGRTQEKGEEMIVIEELHGIKLMTYSYQVSLAPRAASTRERETRQKRTAAQTLQMSIFIP